MNPRNDDNRRILIIDDNRMIHADFEKILSPEEDPGAPDEFEAMLLGKTNVVQTLPSFELLYAAQGQDGADIVKAGRENDAPIALAFVDMRMPPGWDGVETIEHIWKHDPRVQIAICTAYSDHSYEEIVQKFRYTDQLLFLKKPFDNIEVAQIACAMVNKWNLAQQVKRQIHTLEASVEMRAKELEAAHAKQRETERLFHQSQKMEAIGRLTGGVAHDFNNLLTVVLGYTELLVNKKNELSESAYEKLIAIQTASQSAAKLTQQLLAFSRQQVVTHELLNLNEIIESNLGRVLDRIIGDDIQLEIKLSPDLPTIKADSGQIEQVIMNIVINAKDSMEGKYGKLCLETLCESDQNGDEAVLLKISDTGKGMDDEVREKIFEPFFTTKDLGKGTGLGLSTVYGIISRFNARIWVDSKLGEGTTFTISFPSESKIEKIVAKEEQLTNLLTGSETIFLVEDEDAVRKLTSQMLKDAGYTVIEANNGRQAYEKCLSDKPQFSLLLTDVVMPEMGGRDLAKQIASIMPETPVLFMSGYTGKNPLEDVKKGGISHFLQKPFSHAELLQKIRDVLSVKEEAS